MDNVKVRIKFDAAAVATRLAEELTHAARRHVYAAEGDAPAAKKPTDPWTVALDVVAIELAVQARLMQSINERAAETADGTHAYEFQLAAKQALLATTIGDAKDVLYRGHALRVRRHHAEHKALGFTVTFRFDGPAGSSGAVELTRNLIEVMAER